MSTATAPSATIKTYVLTEALDNDAPIFQTLGNGQRSQIKKLVQHRPYLDIEVYDKQGVSRRLRYKSSCTSPWADEQIEKFKIDANAKFTDIERSDPMFRRGILTTHKKNLQTFLETHPEFEGSEYSSENVKQKCYRLLDKAAEAKVKNEDFKKRLAASNKIANLDLKGAQEMLIRLNGYSFEVPDNLDDCQIMLVEFLDAHEDEGIEAIMKEDTSLTVDEKTTILIGNLVNAKILRLASDGPGIFKMGKDNKEVEVKSIFADSMEEKERLFGQFLNMEDGKALRTDLELTLAEYEKKETKKDKLKT